MEPTPGSDRVISLSADATHFVNLYCVDGFTFRDNKVEFTDAGYPAYGDPEQRFVFKHCDNVSVVK